MGEEGCSCSEAVDSEAVILNGISKKLSIANRNGVASLLVSLIQSYSK